MNASTEIIPAHEDTQGDADWFDMFSDIEPLDPLDAKKDEIAAQLAALASFVCRNRTTLADELGWKKSRVSNVLSGRNNLTIKTIWEFAAHLRYDFDVVFRSNEERRPPQPWQKNEASMVIRSNVSTSYSTHYASPHHPVIDVQTAREVAADLLVGKHKSYYFSIALPSAHESPKSITIDAQAMRVSNTISLRGIKQLAPLRKEGRK